MITNLYQLLTADAARDARRAEFRAGLRTLCHPALCVAYGLAAGAALAAVVLQVTR